MIEKAFNLIVIPMLLLSIIISSFFSYRTVYVRQSIKNAMDASLRVIENSILKDVENAENLSEGDAKQNDILIDKEYLSESFLENFSGNNKDANNIVALILMYKGRYEIFDNIIGAWKPPIYYSLERNGELLYLNTESNETYYFNSSGNIIYATCESKGISDESRVDYIYEKLNQGIYQYTYSVDRNDGFGIKLKNPYESENEEKFLYSFFNPLDDVSVIAIYKNREMFSSVFRIFEMPIYEITGYTIK